MAVSLWLMGELYTKGRVYATSMVGTQQYSSYCCVVTVLSVQHTHSTSYLSTWKSGLCTVNTNQCDLQ